MRTSAMNVVELARIRHPRGNTPVRVKSLSLYVVSTVPLDYRCVL